MNHHLITERDHVIYKILNRYLEAGILQAKIGEEGRHWALGQQPRYMAPVKTAHMVLPLTDSPPTSPAPNEA